MRWPFVVVLFILAAWIVYAAELGWPGIVVFLIGLWLGEFENG